MRIFAAVFGSGDFSIQGVYSAVVRSFVNLLRSSRNFKRRFLSSPSSEEFSSKSASELGRLSAIRVKLIIF